MNELFEDGARAAAAPEKERAGSPGRQDACAPREAVVVYDVYDVGGQAGENVHNRATDFDGQVLRERVEDLKVRAVQVCDWFERSSWPADSMTARMLKGLREAAEKVG